MEFVVICFTDLKTKTLTFQTRPFGNVWMYFGLLWFEKESLSFFFLHLEARMLLNLLQCTGQLLKAQDYEALAVTRAKVENLWIRLFY